ncbi:2OG-Fe(II) oxygenase [Fusarium oxysporum f. sp. phaseoli]
MSDYSDEGSESSSVDEYAESTHALSRTLDSIRSTEDDAQAIKSVCQQAPFDHRNRTVVDTSVRNTWELDASNFNLVNKNWFEDFSSRILRYTARGLGLFELRADPHKLLLYEPGSFFQPHKDSEKEQGMIGTLVVCLPSQHEGGDYSDVTHEVERLTSGYRLVLPYKLFATGEDELWASIFFQQTKDLKSILAKFRTDLPKVGKLLYPLEHLYTESSLCLRNLKGRDRSIGRYLNEICSEACFYFMFGQTTHFQVGIDDCDEYQDQTTLRTLYNLNGDQLSSELVLNLENFLDYDIGREAPDIEDEGGLFGKAEEPRVFHYHKTVACLMPKEFQELIKDTVSAKDFDSFCAAFKSLAKHPLYLRDSRSGQIPFAKKRYNLRLHGSMTTHFSSSTPKKRSGDEEWILLQTFLQKIVPRAESSLLLFLLQHMSSERTGSFKKFPELYKFTLEHDGQLDFPVEKLKSGLITGRWSQGSELVEQLKEGYIKLCGTRSLADIGAELQNFQRQQGALAPI